jgi:hypothetical protein
VEKKNRDEIIVKFENSPKILISTNYAPTGIDESSLRRQFILEFADYFNLKYTPEMEFGKRFFDDWSVEEWNSFYNFMIGCLQYYLQNGLVEYTRINLDQKKLIFSTSEEFIDFMDEIELENHYEKKEQFQKFIDLNPNLKTMHQKTFSRWLKIFAKLKNFKYVEKKSGAKRYFVLSNKTNGRMDEAKCSLTGDEDII